jgi:hypothetical protein
MAGEAQLVSGAIALAQSVVEALGPVVAAWIDAGDVNAIEALAKVIPVPEVLAARDAALVVAQRKLAEEALGDRGRHAEARRREGGE